MFRTRLLVILGLALNHPGLTLAQATRTVPVGVRVEEKGGGNVGAAHISGETDTNGNATINVPTKVGVATTLVILTVNVTDDSDSHRPIVGADVGLSGAGVYSQATDASGRAVFSVTQFGTFVITVSQDRYDSGRGSVQLRDGDPSAETTVKLHEKPKAVPEGAGTASATVTLEPGEVSSDTPIKLIIGLFDMHGDAVTSGAAVRLYLPTGAELPAPEVKGNEAAFNSVDTGVVLEVLRRGLRVRVDAPGYMSYLSSVPVKFLEPQLDASRYSVMLSRSWEELTKAIDQLQAVVSALNAEANALPTGAGRQEAISGAIAARKDALTQLTQIEAAYRTLVGDGAPTRGRACSDAAGLQGAILLFEAEAVQRGAEVTASLERASGMGTSCQVPGDSSATRARGEAARAQYNNAVRSYVLLGSLVSQAVRAQQQLVPLAQAASASTELLARIRLAQSAIDADQQTADRLRDTFMEGLARQGHTAESLTGRIAVARAQLGAVRQQLQAATLWEHQERPPDVLRDSGTRLDLIQSQLAAADLATIRVTSAGVPQEIMDAADAIEPLRDRAADAINKNAAAICSVDSMDDALGHLKALNEAANVEVVLYRSVLEQADACITGTVPASSVDATQNQDGPKDPKDPTPSSTSSIDPSQNQDAGKDPGDSKLPKDSKNTGKSGLQKTIDAINTLNNFIREARLVDSLKKQPPAPPVNGGAGAPPSNAGTDTGTGSAPPGDSTSGSFGNLSGTWEKAITDVNNCTIWMIITLQPAGPNTWTGASSWRDSGCANPYANESSHWRFVATSQGAATVTVVEQVNQQTMNYQASFTATTITVSGMNFTFTRK